MKNKLLFWIIKPVKNVSRQHYRKQHEDNNKWGEKTSPADKKQKQFECDNCEMSFTQKKTLIDTKKS